LEDGVQPLEAMLYTLQLINKDPDLLPGIKLGMIAYDSCDSPAYALEQTLDIIKGRAAVTGIEHPIVTLRQINTVPGGITGPPCSWGI
jgi:hypothetical protein